jgi:hypothetical protein
VAGERVRGAAPGGPVSALAGDFTSIPTAERVCAAQFVALTCRLPAAEAESLARRLQVRRSSLDAVLNGVQTFRERLPRLAEPLRPSAVVDLLDGLGETDLLVAWAIAPTHPARSQIVQYVEAWRDIRQTMTGETSGRWGCIRGLLW